MKCFYAKLLADEELRSHLERGDTVLFTEDVKDWHGIEQQVERLGFGEQYVVLRGTKPEPNGLRIHTRLSPLFQPSAGVISPAFLTQEARSTGAERIRAGG